MCASRTHGASPNQNQKGQPQRIRGAGNRMIATSGGTLSGKGPTALNKHIKALIKNNKPGEVRNEAEVATLIHEVVMAHSYYATPDYHSGMTRPLEAHELGRLKERINGIDGGRFGNMHGQEKEKEEDIPAGRVHISNRPWFSFITCSAITVNAIQMGVEVDHPELAPVTNSIEHTVLAIFVIEMIVRIYELRLKYFCEAWNIMEFSLVALGCADVWLLAHFAQEEGGSRGGISLKNLSLLRVMRLMRFFRGIRLLSIFESLFLIIDGMIKSIPMIGWVSLLLLVLLYICAVFVTDLIGHDMESYAETRSEDIEVDLNNYQYFGTLPRSMYTLFNIVILAEWPEFSRSILERQPELFFFFVTFIMVTSFGLMNVVIGVIVENTQSGAESIMDDAGAEEAVESLENLGRLHAILFSLDRDDSHVITKSDFVKVWMKEPVVRQEFFQLLDLPRLCSAEECFDLLDQNGEGKVRAADFTLFAFRLLDHSGFQQNMVKHFLMNRIMRRLQKFIKKLEKATRQKNVKADDLVELPSVGDIPNTKEGNSNFFQMLLGDKPDKKPDTNGSNEANVKRTNVAAVFSSAAAREADPDRKPDDVSTAASNSKEESPATDRTRDNLRAAGIAEALEVELSKYFDTLQSHMGKRSVQLELLQHAIDDPAMDEIGSRDNQPSMEASEENPAQTVTSRSSRSVENIGQTQTSRSDRSLAVPVIERVEKQLDGLAECDDRIEEHLQETRERLSWIESHVKDMRFFKGQSRTPED